MFLVCFIFEVMECIVVKMVFVNVFVNMLIVNVMMSFFWFVFMFWVYIEM